MKLKHVVLGIVLLITVFAATGCGSFLDVLRSAGSWVPRDPRQTSTTASITSPTQPSARPSPTSTSTTTFTRSTTSTTATTTSPLETYRAEMRAWKNRYAARLEAGYAVIRGMDNPMRASQEEIQAARDLDDSLSDMAGDLVGIKPPPHLSSAHSVYLTSLQDLARSVHQLATALEQRDSLASLGALATIAQAWQDGAPARKTLEQALGFSLTSAD